MKMLHHVCHILVLWSCMFHMSEQCLRQTPRVVIEKCCEICCQNNNTKNEILRAASNTATQSAFSAIANGDRQTGDKGEVVIFHEATVNTNNHFSLATNVFTCRFPGVYYFSFTIGVGGNTDPIIALVKNGQRILSTGTRTGPLLEDSLAQSGNSVLLDLQAGDQVWLQFWSAGDQVYATANKFTSFSGFLLYPKEQKN